MEYEWGPWSSCNPDGYRTRNELCEDANCAIEYEACIYYGKYQKIKRIPQNLFCFFQSPNGVHGHPAQTFVEMVTRHDFGTAKAIHFAVHF